MLRLDTPKKRFVTERQKLPDDRSPSSLTESPPTLVLITHHLHRNKSKESAAKCALGGHPPDAPHPSPMTAGAGLENSAIPDDCTALLPAVESRREKVRRRPTPLRRRDALRQKCGDGGERTGRSDGIVGEYFTVMFEWMCSLDSDPAVVRRSSRQTVHGAHSR